MTPQGALPHVFAGKGQGLAGALLVDELQPGIADDLIALLAARNADRPAPDILEAVGPALLLELPPQGMGIEDPDVPAGPAGELDGILANGRIEQVA